MSDESVLKEGVGFIYKIMEFHSEPFFGLGHRAITTKLFQGRGGFYEVCRGQSVLFLLVLGR